MAGSLTLDRVGLHQRDDAMIISRATLGRGEGVPMALGVAYCFTNPGGSPPGSSLQLGRLAGWEGIGRVRYL